MHYLSLEEILWLHFQIIKDYGGSHGVREERRLEAVAAAPKQEVFGQEQYSDIYQKAAVYLCNIIGDHPFVDGNNRTAVTVCGIFLLMNGKMFTCSPKELEDFAVRIATDHLGMSVITDWLRKYCL